MNDLNLDSGSSSFKKPAFNNTRKSHCRQLYLSGPSLSLSYCRPMSNWLSILEQALMPNEKFRLMSENCLKTLPNHSSLEATACCIIVTLDASEFPQGRCAAGTL